MKILSFLSILLLFLLASCTSLKKVGLKEYPVDPISKENYEKLNGIYANKYDTIAGELKQIPIILNAFDYIYLTDQLFLGLPYKAFKKNDGNYLREEEALIKIEFISSKKAIIGIYDGEELLSQRKIRGRFKDGCFYLRSKKLVLPLFPIVVGYNFNRVRIGKSGDNLVVDFSENRWAIACIFIMAGGSSSKGYVSAVYKEK